MSKQFKKTELRLAISKGQTDTVREMLNSMDVIESRFSAENCTLLCEALKGKHLEIIELLLKKGCQVNVKDQESKSLSTPLHLAVTNGDSKIVQLLLNYGAAVNAKTNEGITPLYLACKGTNHEIVGILLVNGAQILGDNNNRTPLHNAAKVGHAKIVRQLIDFGADVNAKIKRTERMPIHVAAEHGQIKVLKLLLKHGADINAEERNGMMPISLAVHNGHLSVVKLFLSMDSEVPQTKYTALLHLAIRHGHNKIVEYLIDCGADIHTESGNDTFLSLAIKHGHLPIVENLLNNGAHLDVILKNGQTILYTAASIRGVNIVQLLLQRGAQVNCRCTHNHETLLHVAARRGLTYIVRVLLQYNATVNIKNKNGETPIYFAVKYGHLSTVEELLEYVPTEEYPSLLITASENGQREIVRFFLNMGVPPNSVIQNGLDFYTPLSVAIKNGHESVVYELLKYNLDVDDKHTKLSFYQALFCNGQNYRNIVKALLQYGFDISEEYINDTKLLYTCVVNEYEEVLKYLLECGANVDALCNECSIPYDYRLLHVASMCGSEKIVKLLLQYKANPNLSDRCKLRPIHYALEHGYPTIIAELLNKGASEKDACSILFSAIEKDDLEVVEIILKHGIDVNCRTTDADTPLHVASRLNRIAIIKILLQYGADIDAVNDAGKTPIFSAVPQLILVMITRIPKFFNHICEDAIDLLIRMGANVNYCYRGNMILHIACRCEWENLITTLLNYDADVTFNSRDYRTPLNAIIGQQFNFMSMPYNRNVRFTPRIHSITELLIKHIAKVLAKTGYVSQQDMELIKNTSSECREFFASCTQELDVLQTEYITNKISLFDILTKNTISLARAMRQEDLIQAYTSNNCETKFPLYSSILKERLRIGSDRNHMIDHVKDHLTFILQHVFPDHIMYNILDYLGIKDLRIMMIVYTDTVKMCE